MSRINFATEDSVERSSKAHKLAHLDPTRHQLAEVCRDIQLGIAVLDGLVVPGVLCHSANWELDQILCRRSFLGCRAGNSLLGSLCCWLVLVRLSLLGGRSSLRCRLILGSTAKTKCCLHASKSLAEVGDLGKALLVGCLC